MTNRELMYDKAPYIQIIILLFKIVLFLLLIIAIITIMDKNGNELEKYNKDPRVACKYGSSCYQKNPDHHKTYKHPPKNRQTNLIRRDEKEAGNRDNQSKKRKIQDYFKAIPKATAKKDSSEKVIVEITDKNKIGTELKDSLHCKHEQPETSNHCQSFITEKNEKEEQSTDHKNTHKETSFQVSEPEETLSAFTKSPRKTNNQQSKPVTLSISDAKEFIKSKFLFEMPEDFYQFWDYCKSLNIDDPCNALKDIGLYLVGPYDVVAGKFHKTDERFSDGEYLLHWRYYYDPPELQTVLRGDNATGYHIGYFRDSPDELPSLLAENHAKKNGEFQIMGDNIFAAVYNYIDEAKKSMDPFKKMQVTKFQEQLKKRAMELKLGLEKRSEKIKKRSNKVVTKTFNKIGLIVPYNRKTQLGYRELTMPDKKLRALLDKLQNASDKDRPVYLSELQPVITFANIAADEFDFGTLVELGWDIISHGIDSINLTALRALTTAYKLLKKNAFATIAEAHLNNRKRGCQLSILD